MSCFFARTILLLSLIMILVSPQQSSGADIVPQAKTMGTLAMYGAVGGALLGTASMAFGTNVRSVFQGASLGLYAGILFGTYVLISHSYTKRDNPGGSYPDIPEGPYQPDEEDDDESEKGPSAESGASSAHWWRLQQHAAEKEGRLALSVGEVRDEQMLQLERGRGIYLHLVQLTF